MSSTTVGFGPIIDLELAIMSECWRKKKKKEVMEFDFSRDPKPPPPFTYINFTQYIFYGWIHMGHVTFHRSFTLD